MSLQVYTIDVAHPPLPPDAVEEEILTAIQIVNNSSTLKVVKIIHGKGTPGKESKARVIVRNWLYRNRHRFKGIIDGEDFNLYNATVEEMLKVVGYFDDPDLSRGNSGVTFVWVKA